MIRLKKTIATIATLILFFLAALLNGAHAWVVERSPLITTSISEYGMLFILIALLLAILASVWSINDEVSQ